MQNITHEKKYLLKLKTVQRDFTKKKNMTKTKELCEANSVSENLL